MRQLRMSQVDLLLLVLFLQPFEIPDTDPDCREPHTSSRSTISISLSSIIVEGGNAIGITPFTQRVSMVSGLGFGGSGH